MKNKKMLFAAVALVAVIALFAGVFVMTRPLRFMDIVLRCMIKCFTKEKKSAVQESEAVLQQEILYLRIICWENKKRCLQT